MKLPEGAKFIEHDNWNNLYNWTFDPKTRIASLEDEGVFGKDINVGNHHTLSFHDLGIQFPGAEVKSEQLVSLKVTGIPYKKGANEENIIVEDSISFIIYGKEYKETLTDFYSHKGSIGNIYDHEVFRQSEDINWTISFSKNFNDKSLEKLIITDKDLDERLYYKGITIEEDYIADYRVKIEVIKEDGTSEIITKSSPVKDKKRFDFKDENVKEVVISVVDASIIDMDLINFTIHTGIKDPKKPLIIDDKNYAFTNSAKFDVKYKDEKEQNIRKDAISTIIRLDPRVYLDRKIVKKDGKNVENVFVNEVINTNLTMGVNHIVRKSDKINIDSVIEILPEGINYVEGSSKVTINNKENTKAKAKKLEPKIIYDYKGTGKTALIWNFEAISLEENIKFEENIEDLISINYNSKITEYTNKGDNEFEAYLKLSNEEYFKPKNEVNDDLNINEGFEKKIEMNIGKIHFKPAKELLVKKEVKGSLNDNYRLTPNIGHTEAGEEVSFKVTIMNNREDAIESLYLMDIFPFKGDVELTNLSNRASTLDLSLEEIIGVPDEFDLYYTTDKPGKELVDYYQNSNWTKEVSDLADVRAIKLELRKGINLKPEYRESFELKFRVPLEVSSQIDDKISNSIFTSSSSKMNFTESNTATAEISKYLIRGIIFEDTNKDGKYNEENDRLISDLDVYLYDKDGRAVLNSEGDHIKVKSDSKGEYSIGVKDPGEYKIKVGDLKGYELINKGKLTEPMKSHIKEDSFSPVVKLDSDLKKVSINAGFNRELTNVNVEKIWIDSPEELPDIDIQLYRNNEKYGDPITLKSGENNYTWEDLYLTDEDGNEYNYTVDEINPPKDYSKKVDGYKIINTYLKTYNIKVLEVDENGEVLEELENLNGLTKEELSKKLDLKKSEYSKRDYKIVDILESEDGKLVTLKISKVSKPEEIEPEDPDLENKLDRTNHFEYIQGYPDKTIRPENNITREEVAAVFYRLLNEEYKEEIYSLNNNFKDLPSKRWSNKHISTLANGGILTGYEDGEFKYGNFITRAEVATIASRFENLEVSSHNFTDVKGHWAEEYIGSVSKKGWVEGYEDGSFKPDEYITRAEFVTLVNRVLDRGVKKENILEGIKEFTDLKENKWYYEEFVEAINGHIFYKVDKKDRTSEKWIKLEEFNIDM